MTPRGQGGSDRKKIPTRERLKREALRLFATNGFEGVTVGDIEAAAGLQPRRGALYRHFRSKEELLELAVQEAATERRRSEFDAATLAFGEVADVARRTGRWILADLDALRDIMQIIEREGCSRTASSNAGPTRPTGPSTTSPSVWRTGSFASSKTTRIPAESPGP